MTKVALTPEMLARIRAAQNGVPVKSTGVTVAPRAGIDPLFYEGPGGHEEREDDDDEADDSDSNDKWRLVPLALIAWSIQSHYSIVFLHCQVSLL